MGTLANIAVEPCDVTWGETDLGFLDGDIEISMEEQSVDITAHQEGTNVLDSVRTGKSVEVSLTLKEVTAAKLADILKAGGGSNTPAAGTEFVGWGKSQDFTGMLGDAKKLVLHPVGAGTDKSKDVAFWKAYPLLSSITYSAENPKVAAVTFKVFPDTTKPDAVRLFGFGDHSQTFV